MGRLVVTEYISVDGVVEAPSGDEPFERVGWTDAFSRGPDGDQFKVNETMAADAQLLGRVTYEQFAAAWPHYEGEFPDYFNAMPKHVVSSTLTDPEWNNTTVIEGHVIEHDLIDALHLLVYPVIVGGGKRLFDRTNDTKRLRLVEARTVGDEGVQLMIYERAA